MEQMKGALAWLVRQTRRAGPKDFYPAVAALVSPVQNSFFLTTHYFTLQYVSPSSSNLGRHSYRAGRSLNMYLMYATNFFTISSAQGYNFYDEKVAQYADHSICSAYAKNLLLHSQFTPTFCYRMLSIRLKADNMQFFQGNIKHFKSSKKFNI